MTLPNAAPKPPKREPKPRKELKRSSPVGLSKTPIKKQGETKRKKVMRQKAFYASKAWKDIRRAAIERAGKACEYSVTEIHTGIIITCNDPQNLQVHHKTYARFGGKERPEDLMCVCLHHHQLIEARDHPTRMNGRSV